MTNKNTHILQISAFLCFFLSSSYSLANCFRTTNKLNRISVGNCLENYTNGTNYKTDRPDTAFRDWQGYGARSIDTYKNIAENAYKVFYDHSVCGHNPTDKLGCNDLGILAGLDSDPKFGFAANFPCSSLASGHSKCRSFVTAIQNWIENNKTLTGEGSCKSYKWDGAANVLGNYLGKLYCYDLISSFLAAEKCSDSSGQSDCVNYVQERMFANRNSQICKYSGYSHSTTPHDFSDCTGAKVNTSGGSEDDTNTDTTGSGLADGGNPDPDSSQVQDDLGKAMDNARNNAFGGQGGRFDETQVRSNVTLRDRNIEGIDSGPGVNDSPVPPGGYNPGQNTALLADSKLFGGTQGVPGGSKKDVPNSPVGAGGGGGGVAGAPNIGSNSRGGGSQRGGHRGGSSRYRALADNINKGFMSTEGGPGGGSSSTNNAGNPPSEMDRRVARQIADNRNKGLGIGNLQKNFDSSLNQGNIFNQNIEVNFFPENHNVYEVLIQDQDLLNENGFL